MTKVYWSCIPNLRLNRHFTVDLEKHLECANKSEDIFIDSNFKTTTKSSLIKLPRNFVEWIIYLCTFIIFKTQLQFVVIIIYLSRITQVGVCLLYTSRNVLLHTLALDYFNSVGSEKNKRQSRETRQKRLKEAISPKTRWNKVRIRLGLIGIAKPVSTRCGPLSIYRRQ